MTSLASEVCGRGLFTLALLLTLGGAAACPGAAGRGPRGPEALLRAAQEAEERGETQRARQSWEALRVVAEGGRDLPALVTAHLALMRLEAEAGDANALAVVLGRALRAELLLKDHGAQARLQLGAAGATRLLGQIRASGTHLALAGGHATRAGESDLRAAALAGQAEVAAIGGDYATAVTRLGESTSILDALGPKADPSAALAAARTARLLRNLGLARRMAGLALLTAPSSPPPGKAAVGEGARQDVRVEALLELARIHQEAGEIPAARARYQEGLRRLQGRPRLFGLAAWAFGGALDSWGDSVEAEKQLGLATEALSRVGDRYGVARLELARGRGLERRGRPAEAKPWLEKAAVAFERLGDPFGAGQARILLAAARMRLGEAADAIGELTQALDHGEAAGAPELTFRAYALLGVITETVLDRSAQAERFHRGAVTALEKVRSALDPLAAGDHDAQESAYYALARVAVRQWRQTGDPAQMDGVLAAVERFRSQQLVDVFSRVGASLADSAEDRRRARAMAGLERALAEALVRPGGSLGLRRALVGQLHQVREERARLEESAFRMAVAYPTPVTVGILKQAMGEEDAMLVSLTGEQGSLLIAITNMDAQVVDAPPRHELARAVESFRALMDGTAPPDSSAYRQAGEALRRLLWEPFAAHLGKRRRVHLVLTGPLGKIPFAALPDAAGRPLGLSRSFIRVPSPAGWLRLRDTPRGQSASRSLQVIALGSGTSQAPSSPHRDALTALGHRLRPSAGALDEGRALLAAVAPKDPGGQLMDPRKTALIEKGLTEARWLHFASPAVLPEGLQGPLQPALVVAAGSEAKEDGLLLLGDLLGMPFDAELLSVGAADEGHRAPSPLAGDILARTLQIAGVRACLLPLRARRAKATHQAAFLQVLYRRLATGDSLADAQLAAQQAAWRASPGDPRPLAAFALYGAY